MNKGELALAAHVVNLQALLSAISDRARAGLSAGDKDQVFADIEALTILGRDATAIDE